MVAVLAAAALVLVAQPAVADQLQDDLAAGGSTTITLNGSSTGSTSIGFSVHATGNDKCDYSATKSTVVSFPGLGSGLTASPSSITFASCDVTQRVTFTATKAGTWDVNPAASDNLNVNPAKFSITASKPANTPPTVAVTGVSDGSSYAIGQVPSAACNATDAEDGSSTFAATLGTISGPLAGYGLGSRTATCSYTDKGGLSATAEVTYSIVDTVAPVLAAPGDQVVEATGPSGASVTWDTPAASDNVAVAAVGCSPASGSVFSLENSPHAVTCTATDVAGNATTHKFNVTVRDTTVPALSVGSDVTVEATGPAGAVARYDAATATDTHDGTLTPACDPASGSTFPLGDTTVTCSVADSSGNEATGTLGVHVTDTTAPAVHVPERLTVEATKPAGADVDFAVTASDLVDGSVTPVCDVASGSTFGFGTTTVSCEATDKHGNTGHGQFEVLVQDTTPAALHLPDDQTREATGPDGAVVTYSATATDASDDDVQVDCIPASGSTFGLGATRVTCTATPAHGPGADGTFEVTVRDSTAPTLTLPGDFKVEATGPDGAVVTYDASASDIVDGETDVHCGIASGDTVALGVHTVDCASTDSHGNQATGSFTVTVQDTTAPDLTVPEDRSIEATGPDGAVTTFTASAEDLVDGDTDVACTPASGAAFPLGSTTVTCTTADEAGNQANKSFVVNVTDTTAPELSLPEPITREATGPGGATVEYDASATDLVDGPTAVDCVPPSGSTFALGQTSVQCTSVDKHTNKQEGAFTVTVQDTTAPALHVPDHVTAEATGPGGAGVDFTVTAADLVDGAVDPACDHDAGSVFPLGDTTVTCTATDEAGNTSDESFTVTVADTTAPGITVPATMVEEATGPAGTAVTFTVTATDLVDGGTVVTCDPASGSTFGLGTTTVTCSSSDKAGNESKGSFDVTVRDTTAPTLSLPSGVAKTATSATGAVVTYTATASDLVDGVVPVSCTPSSGSQFGLGTATVACTATDRAGNTKTGSFDVRVSFAWTGFYRPVDSGSGAVNVIKAGSTVPLKWSISDGASGYIGSLGVVTSTKQAEVSCETNDEEVTSLTDATLTGGTSLRYDATANQYVYNWQSPKKAGSCYRVTVNLAGGDAISAKFRLK